MSIIKMKQDPEVFLNHIKEILRKMYRDPKSLINRRLNKKRKNKYELTYQDRSDSKTSKSEEDFISEIIEKREFTKDELDKFIQTPFVGKFNDDDANIRIVMDTKTNRYYFVTNHSFYDGWALMQLTKELYSDKDSVGYDVQLPKLTYCPFVFEYMFIKTLIDISKLKKSQLALETDKPVYKNRQILHIQMSEKDLNDLAYVEVEKEYHYMTTYVYGMMRLFFDAYPDRQYYNVMTLAAINNPNKINNVSCLMFVVERNDTIEVLHKKIKSRRQHVSITYFYLNSLLGKSRTNKKHTFDICFSSVPYFKQNNSLEVIGAVVPFNSCPVYILNCKIHKTTTASIHFGTKVLDVSVFEKTLQEHKLSILDKTIFE